MRLVTIARIVRPRGNRGEVAAIPLTDHPEKFERVFLNQAPFTVERAWLHRKQVIFKFAGVNSISDAERFAGMDVSIPLEERPAPADGEYYQSDLLGCALVDRNGRPIGTVESWQEYGGTPLLGVRTPEGREVLVPFAKSICTNIDIAARRIVVQLPDGLMDLA